MKRMIIIITSFLSLNLSSPNINCLTLDKEALKRSEFSEFNLKMYMLFSEIQAPDIVMKQAKLETSHFSSSVFNNNNNLFGMHFPIIRETTAIGYTYGDNGKLSIFDHWTDSVDDYFLWQKFNKKHMCNDYYATLINAGYAVDKRYINKLKQI